MANRVIKEGIWNSSSLAKLSLLSDILWPRFLLLADDWGCFNADFQVIKGLVFPKRKEITAKKVSQIICEFSEIGQLFLWDDGDREWGYFVNWDKHQFVGSLQYDNGGNRVRHRRKTPEPPKDLLDNYLKKYGAVWSSAEQCGAKVPIPIPIPIPIPNPNKDNILRDIKSRHEPSLPEKQKRISKEKSFNDILKNQMFMQKLQQTYIGVDLKTEFRKMQLWLIANPTRDKKNYERFVINWLNKIKLPSSDGLTSTQRANLQRIANFGEGEDE